MSKISTEQLEHLSLLSRLKLAKEEQKEFAEQIPAILDWVEQLKEVDVSDVEISAKEDLKNVWRKDSVLPSDCADKIIANAPEKEGRHIKVKSVFK
jgi:aspartyl-tRNA(Asn)/glutamyl-tRNA(Gln) amidotransferase subunit C